MNIEQVRLNPPQKEAVLCTDGPLLILAGAGSGKTRVLTYRIAYLIEEKKINPWNILAITFTNKAAEEMRNRAAAMTPEGSSVFVSTFHSACVRFLRADADLLGYTRDFTIYDTDDQRVLMRQIIKQKDFDTKLYREKEVLRRISSAKNEMMDAEDFGRQAMGYQETRIAELYAEYTKRLLAANAMDFDDLLLNAVKLFREYPDVCEKYQRRFAYIMVDEYQDTNRAQFELVALLAKKHRNICVVGDDDQSIYRFRGADVRNILDFEKAFPGARVIRLEQNYRSTKTILDAANSVIAHNSERKEKKLWSDNPQGEKIVFQEFDRAEDEALFIARDIEKEKNRFSYGSCAILYRTNAQSRALEEAFVRQNLPYRLIGGTNFYDRREIRDMLAYLRALANPNDDVSLRRIINVPRRGIGDTTIERIAFYAAERELSFFEALREVQTLPEMKRAAGKLKVFTDLMDGLKEASGTLRVWQLIEEIYQKSGYEAMLREEDAIEAQSRRENVQELENKAADMSDESGDPEALGRFLEEVALVADVDSLPETEERVVLMTLHSAKGLEFPKVYLAGMEQGVFPGNQAVLSANPSDIEEERRLCYVGITRAKERLVMTAARLRMVNGETQFHNISQFVEEITPSLLERRGRGRMETREQTELRQWKRGDYGSGPRRASGERTESFFAGEESSFRRKPAQEGWQDFGESFGFGAGLPFGKARPAAADPALGAYLNGPKKQEGALSAEEIHPGDRVCQKRFGTGTVLKVQEGKRDTEVTVAFDQYGEKVMLAAFAAFTRPQE